MILTLIILWVGFSVVFFGSLAVAASRPIPPIDHRALIDDPTLKDYPIAIRPGSDFGYQGASATASKLEGAHS